MKLAFNDSPKSGHAAFPVGRVALLIAFACHVVGFAIFYAQGMFVGFTLGFGGILFLKIPLLAFLNWLPPILLGIWGWRKGKPSLALVPVMFVVVWTSASIVHRTLTAINNSLSTSVFVSQSATLSSNSLTTVGVGTGIMHPSVRDIRALASGALQQRSFTTVTRYESQLVSRDDYDPFPIIGEVTTYRVQPISECSSEDHLLSVPHYALELLQEHCLTKTVSDRVPPGDVMIAKGLKGGEKIFQAGRYDGDQFTKLASSEGLVKRTRVLAYLPFFAPFARASASRYNDYFAVGPGSPFQEIPIRSGIFSIEKFEEQQVAAFASEGNSVQKQDLTPQQALALHAKFTEVLKGHWDALKALNGKLFIAMMDARPEQTPVSPAELKLAADSLGRPSPQNDKAALGAWTKFSRILSEEQTGAVLRRVIERIQRGEMGRTNFAFLPKLQHAPDPRLAEQALEMFRSGEYEHTGHYIALGSIARLTHGEADHSTAMQKVFDALQDSDDKHLSKRAVGYLVAGNNWRDRVKRGVHPTEAARAKWVKKLEEIYRTAPERRQKVIQEWRADVRNAELPGPHAKWLVCQSDRIPADQIGSVIFYLSKGLRGQPAMNAVYLPGDKVDRQAFQEVCGRPFREHQAALRE